ncbi:MAG: CPBP family intramembrane metalloprotease [Planctomycetia bacterium]|nr:CPBP family intramembrane metalloprotease [Planctomycetia bacterium]
MHRNVPDAHLPGMEQSWNVLTFFLGMFQKSQWRTTFILLYATFAVTLWKYLPAETPLVVSTPSGWQMVPPDTAFLSFVEKTMVMFANGKIWGAFLLFGLLPMGFVKFLFREKLADYGVRFGNRATLGFTLVLVPVLGVVGWFSGFDPAFYTVYPYSPWCLGGESHFASGWPFFAMYAVMYLFLYYFSWEFFFRGFLQVGTEASVGCFNAILLQTMLSTVVHFGNPCSETLAAVGAGILWGFLAYRCRSLLTGWLQHASVGILLDFSLLWHVMSL